MGYLERMRSEPRHVKGRHAFVAALTTTLVFAGFWFLSLPAKFSEIAETAEPDVQQDDADGFAAFIGSAREQIGNALSAGGAPEALPQTHEDTAVPKVKEEEFTPETESKSEGRVILIATTSKSATERED